MERQRARELRGGSSLAFERGRRSLPLGKESLGSGRGNRSAQSVETVATEFGDEGFSDSLDGPHSDCAFFGERGGTADDPGQFVGIPCLGAPAGGYVEGM